MIIPQDIDSEQSLLGSILFSPNIMKFVEIVPQQFYEKKHQIIFSAMLSIFECMDSSTKEVPIDITTVRTELVNKNHLDLIGGHIYLAELTNIVPSSANWERYQDAVIESHRKRYILKFLEDNKNLLEEQSSEKLLESMQSSMIKMSTSKSKPQDIKEIAVDRLEYYKSVREQKVTNLLENKLRLPKYKKGDLVVLAARPSQGKTALSLNLSINSGKNVLFFSYEQGKGEIFDRIVCSELGISSTDVERGRLTPQQEDMVRNITNNVTIEDNPSLSIQWLCSVARTMKMDRDIGAIVVDYLQLIPREWKNDVAEIGVISRKLKLLARELDVPVIVLSQLSRKVEDRANKEPQLSDLRGSGDIEQDADVVYMIMNEYNELMNVTESTIFIRKNRNWPIGEAHLIFQKNFLKFIVNTEKYASH